jgi:hypothetical protein
MASSIFATQLQPFEEVSACDACFPWSERDIPECWVGQASLERWRAGELGLGTYRLVSPRLVDPPLSLRGNNLLVPLVDLVIAPCSISGAASAAAAAGAAAVAMTLAMP